MRLAHLSDWHATTLAGAGRALLHPKRISGWASWRFSRRHCHSTSVLEAAFRDVQSQNVDAILVTGDLTHVSLEQEFQAAALQLAMLGRPEDVFLIPGNHDCYVPISGSRSWDHWSSYLSGTPRAELDSEVAACLASPYADAPRHQDYPTLRIRGEVAVIGLCSAIATPIFRAGGELGARQLERLENLLVALGERKFFRIIMIHHPISEKGEPARRALGDADALRQILERVGADLVIHGHKHRRRIATIHGPEGEIPIIGVPSTSDIGSRQDKCAQYHIYTTRSRGELGGFALDAEIRGFDAETGEFGPVADQLL